MEPRALRVLDETQAVAFVRDGYLVAPGLFPREVAEALLPEVWRRLPGVTPERSTWQWAALQVEEVITDGPVDDLFTDRYRGCVDDLVGAGRWTTKRGFGWVICRFPGFHQPPWQPPASGWHVDGMDFRHRLTSPEQGLVGIEVLTDIEPGGGGTAVRIGSHAVVSRLLRDAGPAGVGYRQLREWSENLHELPVRELTAAAGDVIWLHPHLVHSRSPNTRQTVRIVANRCISLHAPMVLDRADPGLDSLVELAIKDALRTG